VLVQVLASDRKILVCGNGGSAAAAQQLTAGLVGRFERERPELAAIALSADSSLITRTGNDSGFDEIFSRQVRGLGMAGDVLVGLCSSGNSPNVLAAIASAHERGMRVVALTGDGGGRIGKMLRGGDVHLCVPHQRNARIQEMHLLVIHCLCDGIDANLLGEQE
ncbi:MAG: SIS domain-containing protein, partial [Quisquiliibacterium sp.]